MKLKSVIKKIQLDAKNKVVLDVGSSHGGFVQMMLITGARKIYAVDVGKGLLDWKLRKLSEVTVMEDTNAKDLKPDSFEEAPHIGLVDVSFISLRKILPVMFRIVQEKIIALIKPQFEASYTETSRGKGIITDPAIHARVIDEVRTSVKDDNWDFMGSYFADVKGRKGNQEFFLYYERVQS
ncbi:MAG: SAM-dependent methyltransferase [Elusimicrobiota bacterium]